MRRTLCLLALLASSALAHAEPPSIKLPSEVRGEPGAYLTVRAETTGKVVKWFSPDKGLHIFPSELLADKRVTVVSATKPGNYRLIAWTALGDEPSELARVKVVIEGDTPEPVPPTPPGPGPKPPTPPAPTDPFVTELSRLLAADPGNPLDKGVCVASLVQLYRQATGTAEDKAIETVGDLLRVIRQAGATLLPTDALPGVRRRLADHLNTALELDPAAPLTPDRRAFAASVFRRLADTLAQVK